MTNQDLTQNDEIQTQELSAEQLETALGGFAHGSGGGSGKVSMQDVHFLLPAV
jgi:hypothetical protein